MKRTIQVRKSSGLLEDLNAGKLRSSLQRSGADAQTVDEVIDRIMREVGPVTSTSRIYRLARKYLRQYNHASALRYSLKNALLRLGPSGYPFEKYYSALMRENGYRTETGIIVPGRCVQHEIDVKAVREREVHFVECKYHNRPGLAVDVKVAMYVHSRFRDLAAAMSEQHPDEQFMASLITNTRFTSEAIRYAECTGLTVRSWGYPGDESLEKMIEEKRLYPVTIISGVQKGLTEKLIQKDIILLKDLADRKVRDIRKLLSLPEHKAAALKKQADDLCLC